MEANAIIAIITHGSKRDNRYNRYNYNNLRKRGITQKNQGPATQKKSIKVYSLLRRYCFMAALLPDLEALAKDVVKLPKANQCKICKKTIEKPFRCPQCKLIKYCSKECAIEGWPMHKAQCGVELPQENDQDMWEKSLRETATTKRQELCQIS